MLNQKCLECGEKIIGRNDKKFCGSQCRAQFHNRNRASTEKGIIQTNSILRKNRSIMKSLNPQGKATVRQELLKDLGFDFRFHTHEFKTATGDIYYFCYEWGYHPIAEEKVIIVNWQN